MKVIPVLGFITLTELSKARLDPSSPSESWMIEPLTTLVRIKIGEIEFYMNQIHSERTMAGITKRKRMSIHDHEFSHRHHQSDCCP